MAYTYTPSNITAKQKMNLSVWSLQITSLINSIVELFTSSFLVSFIMQVNVDEPISATLVSIALYYISLYAVMFIAYTLLGYLVDRSNRIGYYRAGILFKGAFIVVIIFLGRDLAQNTILAGAFIGLSEAFYYSSYNVLKGEIIPRAHADKYITVSNILKRVISIVFPILIGYLIDVSTYTTVAIYVLVIVAIQFIFSCLIKSQRPENSVFELFKYLKALRQKTEDTQRIKRFYPAVAGYACTTLISSCITLFPHFLHRGSSIYCKYGIHSSQIPRFLEVVIPKQTGQRIGKKSSQISPSLIQVPLPVLEFCPLIHYNVFAPVHYESYLETFLNFQQYRHNSLLSLLPYTINFLS